MPARPTSSFGSAQDAPGWLPLAFGVFTIWTFEGVMVSVIRGRAGVEVGNADPLSTATNLIVLLSVIGLCLFRRGLLRELLTRGLSYTPIVVVSLLSTFWSIYPIVTLKRAANLSACFIFAFYAYQQYGARRFIRLFAWSTLLPVVLSVVLAILAPGRAYDQHFEGNSYQSGNDLHGAFSNKNQLSLYALLSLISWIYLTYLAPEKKDLDYRVRWVALPVQLFALLLSKGATSVLALGFAMFPIAYFKFGRTRNFRLLAWSAAGLAVLAGVSLSFLDVNALFGAFGKDLSLTGRFPLWAECMDMIAQRPWLGYGYGAFWNADSILTRYIWQQVQWEAPNAHSGFIELALDIGLVGLFVYFLFAYRVIRDLLRNLRQRRDPEAQWYILFVLVMFIENLDEGTLAFPDVPAIIFFFGAALTSAWAKRDRPKTSRPMLAKNQKTFAH